MTTPAGGDGDQTDQSPPVTRLDPGRIPPGHQAASPAASVTRLDSGRVPRPPAGGPATRLDPGRERIQREWIGPLPAELGSRFDLVEELTRGAGQAAIFLVSDRVNGQLRVIKLYHRDVVPNPEVWTWLEQQANSPIGPAGNHIVRVFETGFAAEHAYEVMEYVAGGDLYGLAQPPLAPDPDLLRDVAGQIAKALDTAHDAGIGHRDVKPTNVLIRSLKPLDVALTDFGISSPVGAAGQAHPTRQLTPEYAAPEWLLAGSLSHSVDWWALGMTFAELAGGQHPFSGIRPNAIGIHLANSRPVNLTLVTDPRQKLLCRGLLIRDGFDRWGYEEVAAWCRGESPDVPDQDEAAAADGIPDDEQLTPFDWLGGVHLTPAGLAIALAREWAVATGYFFETNKGADKTARLNRQDLRQWLASLNDSLRPPGGAEHFDQITKGNDKADLKLHRLVRWLNPGLAPVYRGVEVNMAALPGLAQQGITSQPNSALGSGQDAARYVIRDLWDADLLRDLAAAPNGSGLAETDERWHQHEERWRYFATDLRRRDRQVGQLLADVAEDTVLCYLLWLAAAEPAAHAHLRATATRHRADLTDEVSWFWWLTRAEADTPSLLAAILLAGAAESESKEIAATREHQRAARRQALRLQSVERWYRKHDRPTALSWAGAGVIVVAVAWSWGIGLSDVLPFASTNSVQVAWVCAILSLIVFTAAEFRLAIFIGGPYHPRYSLIGAAISRAGRAARPLMRSGPLAITVLVSGAVALAAATIFTPYLLPVLTTVGEIAWIGGRQRQWLADERERAAQLRLAADELRAERART